MSYNGYKNYETWVINLWLTNDYGEYSYFIEKAKECKQLQSNIKEATYDLAAIIEEYIRENSPAGVTGVYADLMERAFDEAEFYEIAEKFMDELE